MYLLNVYGCINVLNVQDPLAWVIVPPIRTKTIRDKQRIMTRKYYDLYLFIQYFLCILVFHFLLFEFYHLSVVIITTHTHTHTKKNCWSKKKSNPF